jgi:hypothetical protein
MFRFIVHPSPSDIAPTTTSHEKKKINTPPKSAPGYTLFCFEVNVHLHTSASSIKNINSQASERRIDHLEKGERILELCTDFYAKLHVCMHSCGRVILSYLGFRLLGFV